MKKIIFLIICICVVLCLVQGNASAKAVYEAGADPAGTVGNFFYSSWWRNTPNDWVQVGSAGYENYLTLVTPYAGLPDLSADPAPSSNDDMTLLITPNAPSGTVVIPAGTWAGYQWAVPATAINSGGGTSITGDRTVEYWQVAGWDSFPVPNLAKVYLVDDSWDGLSDPAATGHVLWSHNAAGFLPNTKDLLTRADSATIRFIVYVPATVQLFNTSYVQANMMNIFTEVYVPVCGDGAHPYPVGDLNQDCTVDFKDFVKLAAKWLDCNDPAAPCNAL